MSLQFDGVYTDGRNYFRFFADGRVQELPLTVGVYSLQDALKLIETNDALSTGEYQLEGSRVTFTTEMMLAGREYLTDYVGDISPGRLDLHQRSDSSDSGASVFEFLEVESFESR
ncbi:hypothetical protein [Novipirellula caenicola]|uniref:hypothetical protein n=1 Tax=Novipirellula caenicola TaxID=1536901 RepID=UPI0031E7BF8C